MVCMRHTSIFNPTVPYVAKTGNSCHSRLFPSILKGGMKRRDIGAWLDRLRAREDQVSIVLSFVIGALVGLVVVAFILLTGRLAARWYPPSGSPLPRILIPP